MRQHNPSLRSDVRQVARSTGSGAAGFFWGTMGILGALYGAGHLLHWLFASPRGWAWVAAIVAGVAMIAFVTSESNPVPAGGGVRTPQPLRPDLRQTGDAWAAIMSGISEER